MRIVFIGTGEIGVPALRALLKSEHHVVAVVTQPDKPAGRAQLIEPTPMKKTVTTANVSVLQPPRIKDPQAIEEIRALTPDVIVVMAYGQILPRDVLEIPKIASLNLHASLLQRWSSDATTHAAMAGHDRLTDITETYTYEGLDASDVLSHRPSVIMPDDTSAS